MPEDATPEDTTPVPPAIIVRSTSPASKADAQHPGLESILPPGTIVIGMAITPVVMKAMREFGWLTGEATPEAVAAAAWAWMTSAWKAGIRAPGTAPCGSRIKPDV